MTAQYLIWLVYACFWVYDWRKNKKHGRAIARLEADNERRMKENEELRRDLIELQIHTKLKRA